MLRTETTAPGLRIKRRAAGAGGTTRSLKVADKPTSVSLEEPFWLALKEIGASLRMTLPNLVTAIDASRKSINLSSALRTFILNHNRDRTRSAEQGGPS